jgi:rubredoxin
MICFVINIKNNFLEVDRKNKSIEIKKFKRFFSPDRLSKVNLKSKDLDSGEGDEEDPETIKEKKRLAEIERLRAAEKFMEIDEGKFECQACGYIYEPEKGDRFAGIEPGTLFVELPSEFNCPACRSPKSQFKNIKKVIAGFAENQKYGLGGNSLTGGQKNALIFGVLGLTFLLLLSGYLLE